MSLAAVLAVSASTLCYEVLLTRLFSIVQWNHLSFLVITIAMLGFAASGVVIQLAPRTTRQALGGQALAWLPTALVAAMFAASRSPLDAFRLVVDPAQLGVLAGLLLALLPAFFLAGMVTACAFASLAPTRAYTAAMLGSALGALAPAALLPTLGLERSFGLAAALPLLPALAQTARERRPSRVVSSVVGVLAVVLPIVAPRLLEVRPNAYKALSQYMRMSGVRHVARRDTLRARYDEIEGVPLRFAPGLSLRYDALLPPQRMIIEDGDSPHVLTEIENRQGEGFLRSLLLWGATVVPPRIDRALVLHADGGLAGDVALLAASSRVELLTDQPELARRLASHYGGRLRVIRSSPRTHLASTPALYDLILVESWGTRLPAMASLSEDHWLTVESLRSMLSRLAPGGVVAFCRVLDLPPNDLVRMLGTAWRAVGGEEPARHTAALRSWDSLLLIVAREPLEEPARERLRSFASRMRYDMVQMVGMRAEEANLYNQMARPYHYEAARALESGSLDPSSPLDVSPLTDLRPFPYHYLRWLRLPAAARMFEERVFSVLLSGEAVVLLVLAAGLASTPPLLLLPSLLAGRARAGGDASGRVRAHLGYFLAIGAGYMLAELGWLHAFGLLLDNPSLAFAAAVGGMLLASAPGGLVAERARSPGLALAVAASSAALLAASLAAASGLLLALAAWLRLALALPALALPAFAMGVPFPAGLRVLTEGRARAWAANGAASVVASAAAPLLAMSLGTPALFLASAACYAIALAVRPSPRSGEDTLHPGPKSDRRID